VNPEPSSARRTVLVAAGFLLLGLAGAHGTLLSSGLNRLPGHDIDTRLIHALLEQGWRAVAGGASFWDPPFFHPAPGTRVYTEMLAGTLPLYGIWRWAGASPGAAYGLWVLSVSLLNYVAAFWLLRRPLRQGLLAAGLGAFLFAFGGVRIGHAGHPQLLPGFYAAWAAGALVRLTEEGSPARLGAWAAAFGAAMAGQLWTSFYVAWFFALGLGLFGAAAWVLPDSRPRVRDWLQRRWPFALLGAAVALALALPYLLQASAAARDLGFRAYDEAEPYLPRLASWFWAGPSNRIYGGLAGSFPFDRIPDPVEHAIGLGWITLAIVVLGLKGLRSSPWGKALGASAAGLILLTLQVGGASLWGLVHLTLPGAAAIRAVCRVANVLLLPAAIGVSAWSGARVRGAGAAVLLLLMLLEQGHSDVSFDRRVEEARVSALAARVDRGASAFLSTGGGARAQVDAMWAALESGVPTVNGYSGNEPPGWDFSASAEDEGELRRRLSVWCARHGADASGVQILR
jgi:hypothetical protein